MVPDKPSAMQPLDEGLIATASRWLDAALGERPMPPLLAVIGLRDGHLLSVLARRAPETRVLALEPDPVQARAFLSRSEWNAWRESGRLTYLSGPDYLGADEAWRLIPAKPDDHQVLVDPAVARDGGTAAAQAAEVLKRIVFGARANADARRAFAPRYLTNSIRNLPAMLAGRDVRELADVYRGLPAVIAAAGPSLDTAIPQLAGLRDRAVLIAADTALRPFLAAGLPPTLAVGVDPGARNARHFHGLPACDATWLVCESAIDPTATDAFGDRTFWFRVANHHPWPWLNDCGFDIGGLPVWGSVLTAAFQLAVLAGCDPIVLVGADLSFTGGRPYARGTTYEFDWAYSTAIGSDLSQAWRMQMAMFQRTSVPDLHGRSTVSTPPLQAFRDWMVTHAARSGRRVINATGAGIFFGDGVEQASLSAALRRTYSFPSLRDLSAGSARTRPRPLELAAHLRQVRHLLTTGEGSPATSPIAQWVEFSAGGYDPEAVGAALDAAAHTLGSAESPGPAHAPGLAPRWADIAWEGATRGVLPHLPELLARLRGILNGVAPRASDERTEADRAALLIDALAMAGPIVEALSTFVENPAAPLPRQAVGQGPVSGLRAWPSEIAWLLQVCEAMLGAACAPSSSPQGQSFFLGPVITRCSLGEPHRQEDGDSPSAAAAQLLREWLICASRHEQQPASVHRLLGHQPLLAVEAQPSAAGAPTQADIARFVITVQSSDTSSTTSVMPLTLDERQLARTLTGLVRAPETDPAATVPLASISLNQRSACLAVRLDASTPSRHVGRLPRRAPLLLSPRVLTDEGVRRAWWAYGTPRGAVCASLLGHDSFLIQEDGSIEPHGSWPRPILAEIPWGDRGSVAWSNGADGWPKFGPGYVMYRESPDAPVTTEELPFRPMRGVWWGDRLYWTCFPSGLGSWAPGQPASLFVPDLPLSVLRPDAGGLELQPMFRNQQGVSQRQRATHAWLWRSPSEPLGVVALGPDGPASCRSSGQGWSAIAHPEADLVRLESPQGLVLRLTCYHPFTVTWVGRSLLICTTTAEMLLFQDLIDILTAWLQSDVLAADGHS